MSGEWWCCSGSSCLTRSVSVPFQRSLQVSVSFSVDESRVRLFDKCLCSDPHTQMLSPACTSLATRFGLNSLWRNDTASVAALWLQMEAIMVLWKHFPKKNGHVLTGRTVRAQSLRNWDLLKHQWGVRQMGNSLLWCHNAADDNGGVRLLSGAWNNVRVFVSERISVCKFSPEVLFNSLLLVKVWWEGPACVKA